MVKFFGGWGRGTAGSDLRIKKRRSGCRPLMLRVLEFLSDVFPWRQAVFSLRPDPCVGEEYAFLSLD